ncbi:plastocyanin/azurin family copper-binding protein [Halobaculum limi]|uniref:plastocyanin/azurin family copper-binding protein n=1 Tax=Halobaculum limi TaxID=3031916 RepID=UPI002406DFD2|nr:plastocyanin/azurin family copper-binding protein [Halobaculum sp. YSMS11]
MSLTDIDRRTLVRMAGSLAVGASLAGCTGGAPAADTETSPTPSPTATPSPEPTATPTPESTATATPTNEGATEVAVGPDGRLRFVPEVVEVGVGDTVRWEALSPGHNVSSLPSADPRCSNPEGAEPFASYEGEQHYAIMSVGDVFEHTFTVPGEYVYVCVPHAGQGMFGTVRVVE